MSGNDKVDYSDYIKHLSNMGSMYSFLSGFMFTAITLVLTRISNPSAITVQSVLFFMGVMLYVFIFYVASYYTDVIALCKKVPSYSGRKSLSNILSDVSVMLGLGGSTILLFLLWGLTYLALAQTVTWIAFSVLTYKYILKPYYERRESVKNASNQE